MSDGRRQQQQQQQQQQPESEPDDTPHARRAVPSPPSACAHVWRVCGPDGGIDEHPDRVCVRCGLEI